MAGTVSGRYAPSPTGDLHVGNLRTALLAWAIARGQGRGFALRFEDLDDRSRPEYMETQRRDLEAIGLDFDSVLVQSDRLEAYAEAVHTLKDRGLLYECYCTRADIRNAPSAPHLPPGAYPGTCRYLTEAERAAGREKLAGMSRGPALRLATGGETVTLHDRVAGTFTGQVDDLVIVRGDGVYAYNLVSVVDDACQGVTQVVRGDDLLESTPRQIFLGNLLGYPVPEYYHVPLVLGPGGDRLAKRDGVVTLSQLIEAGETIPSIIELVTGSLGTPVRSAKEFLATFDVGEMTREPWIFQPPAPRPGG